MISLTCSSTAKDPEPGLQENYKDDIPEETKTRRLNEIISLQNKLSARSKKQDVGKVFEVLIEDFSKRSQDHLSGRTSQNKVVVFPGNGQE